jgi:hypothetical protein
MQGEIDSMNVSVAADIDFEAKDNEVLITGNKKKNTIQNRI